MTAPESVTAFSWAPGAALPAGFVELARTVYTDDPHWLPEDPAAVAQAFSEANPWLKDNVAWLGCVEGRARLAAFFNPTLEVDNHRPAFFGYFEALDDIDACRALFDEARAWAKAQGATALYGPINFTTYGPYRIKLDHFDKRAFPGEPYNPAYYPALLEQLGFDLRYRYATRINEDTASMVPMIEQFYAPMRENLNALFDIRTVDGDFWMAHLEQLYPTIDSIFGNNFAYSPIDFDTFVASCGQPFARKLCPHSSVAAFDKRGQLAGFFLCFPDYSPLMNQGAASPVSASAVNFAEHFSLLTKPRMALAKTGGVHPDYREAGLFNALSCELSLRLLPHYEEAAGAMVREDNPSLRFAARFGPQGRHYGLYWQALNG